MDGKESIGAQLLYTELINWEGLHPKTNCKEPKRKFKDWPLGTLEIQRCFQSWIFFKGYESSTSSPKKKIKSGDIEKVV